MKLFIKTIIYLVIVVMLVTGSTLLFKTHPEVQLAFLLPGIFIFVYAKIRDELYMSYSARLKMARGK